MSDLIFTNVSKSYGEKIVLTEFSARFSAGTCTCLMGPSGCGKTTLLRLCLGLEKPDSGTITGRPRQASAVFQENRLFEGFSTLSNVAAVCPGVSRETIARHLTALGLGDSLSLPVSSLSGGMKRRVAIARAVLATGELLVLDEPFTGLDLETKGAALHYIKTHTQGRTVLLVTHDQAEAEALADTILPLSPVSSEKQSEEAPL